MACSDKEDVLCCAEKKIFNILRSGATPDAQLAEWLRLPLEYACQEGNFDVVDTLLKAGADGSAGYKGYQNRTLLHAAVSGGNEQVVLALLNAGSRPDINVKQKTFRDGGSPLQVAVTNGHESVAIALITAGADMTRTLDIAITEGHEKIALHLILAGADPNETSLFGGKPLALAASRGQDQLVRALLHKGADLSSKCFGSTSLHFAVVFGHVSVAKSLIAAGIDVDLLNDMGETPLHSAAMCIGSTAAIHVLIASGATVEAKSMGSHAIQRATPLHEAARCGTYESTLALLRYGAKVHSVDGSGAQPLHGACAIMEPETADLLLRWGADETAVDNDGARASQKIPTAEQILKSIRDEANDENSDSDASDDSSISLPADKADELKDRLARRERLIRILECAPQDRVWRRRGFVVLCRAHPGRLRLRSVTRMTNGHLHGKLVKTESVEGCVSKGDAVFGEGTRHECIVGGGIDIMAAWLVTLKEEGIFRHVVSFL